MPLSSHRPGHRALHIGVLALAVASFTTMSQTLSVHADDRRDATANTTTEAEVTVNVLQLRLGNIDVSLAQVFIGLQALSGRIPVAQAVYESVVAAYDQRTRERATTVGELSTAQDEQSRIGQPLNQATTQTSDTQRAITDPVCHKYREGNVDLVAVALTVDGVESITDCTAAAGMVLCAGSQAMTTALGVSSFQRTQATHQDAITERITDLEVKVTQTEEETERAKNEVDVKLAEFNSLKEQVQARQAEWDVQRGQVEAFLSQAETNYQVRSAELVVTDAANRAPGVFYVPASGFRNPSDTPIVVTSPFGIRYHPMPGVTKGHSGIDMTADYGTVIHTVAPSYANAVSSNVSAGNHVDINHGLIGDNSVATEYLHAQAQYVSPGQYMNADDASDEVGSAGCTTGCHLYFGVLRNGDYAELMDYL